MPGHKLQAEYLQQSLQEYIDRDCVPPPLCEPFVELAVSESKSAASRYFRDLIARTRYR
jgi:hypothetical protein